MVRIVRLGFDPLSSAKGLQGPLYHTDPAHYSYSLLENAGYPVVPVGDGELVDGTILIPRFAGPLYELVYIVDRLLGPGGCPWDIEQTHESLKRHLLEEAYEVFDAIDSGKSEKLREELGDLLLQPLMHSQMEQRDADWGINEVANELIDKLVRRHPHVFGDASASDAAEVLRNWDRIKQSESSGVERRSILAGVPKGMASLIRAYEVSKRAARAGFEWADIDGVFAKLREEESELREAIALDDVGQIEAELGDLLFTVVNLGRWANAEPEEALRKMVDRFVQRFQLMEANASKPLSELTSKEWDDLWTASKRGISEPTIK